MTLTLTTLVALSALAAPPGLTPPPACAAVRLHVENDMMTFSDSDRFYTNGLRLDLTGCSGAAWQAAARDLAIEHVWRWRPETVTGWAFGWLVGHSLYSPSNILTPADPADRLRDRPYAAWLYAGAFLRLWGATRLDHLELAVGALGPPALGYEIQTRWHQVTGSNAPEGWDQQTGGSPAILLRWVQVRELASWPEQKPAPGPPRPVPPHAADLNGEVEVRAGNVFDTASVALAGRVGWIATSFGPSPVIPALRASPGTGFLEAYLFARTTARLVAWNSTIGGTPFVRDHHRMDAEWFVLDQELGVEASLGPVSLGGSYVIRSTELAAAAWRLHAHHYVQLQLAYHPGQ